MKRIICLITLLCLCVGFVFAFAGCSGVGVEDLDSLIDSACASDMIGNTDYTIKAYGISVTNNDKIYYELNYKTGDHKKAKFTIVDETDFKYTQYITSYYGASVPEGKYTDYWASFPDSLFKLEEAKNEDYQDWYFYPATLYYDKNSEEDKKYYTQKQNDEQSSASVTVKRQFEKGWQDFMAEEKIAKCDLSLLCQTVLGLKDYIDKEKCSVTTKGRISNFVIKIKDDCPVVYQGEALAGKTLDISFTNGKINYFNLEGKFKIYVAYGGAKIMMPNYDTKSLVDYATQIIA